MLISMSCIHEENRPIRIIDRIDPARSLRRGGTGTTGSYAKHRLSFAGGGNTVSFPSKWQLFAKGMYESASIYKAYDAYEKGKYRTAWGYQGGLEFYPMADDNLHIFLTAIGKKYNLSERAKALDASLDDTARLSIGFIYRLPLY